MGKDELNSSVDLQDKLCEDKCTLSGVHFVRTPEYVVSVTLPGALRISLLLCTSTSLISNLKREQCSGMTIDSYPNFQIQNLL